MNVGFRHLPPRVKYVAWIDADTIFPDDQWVKMTVDALQRVPVIQMYSHLRMLDARGGLISLDNSRVATPGDPMGRPGLAWAARRELIDKHRLYDRCGTGANDVVLCHSSTGDFKNYWFRTRSKGLRQDMMAWGAQWYSSTRGAVDFLPITPSHLYHGERSKRGYGPAVADSLLAGYDPVAHTRYDEGGALAWSPDAPATMNQRFQAYFESREEDEGYEHGTHADELETGSDVARQLAKS